MLNDKGMTLVEAVVSIVVLSIIMLAVTTGFIASLKQDLRTANYQSISDDLKIQLDNSDESGSDVVVEITFISSTDAETAQVEAVRKIFASSDEAGISFAKYYAK
ncbi:MAG: prepilin-type N-terminal cleavage/methylation domain-containing protein [Erysipelotrichaceae bacterium]|nr:prepilin-type N-terminal cleavage/methylation domain-containing protein [Erysipelotrichaceae bacterium]